MATNVNFPAHLDISPSALPRLHSSRQPERSVNDDSDEALFGDLAQRLAIQKYGIAGRVWEAAYALSLYINPPSNLIFDPPFVQQSSVQSPRVMLELGSGTGMVSSRIAETLDPNSDILIVTDLPEVCPLLEHNLREYNPSGDVKNVHVKPLSWGNEEHCKLISMEFFAETGVQTTGQLSHIVCSDLVYFPELLAPLLRTLISLTSPPFHTHSTSGKDVDVIISYKIRSLSKETPFWSAFGLWFEFEPVLVKDTTLRGDWQRFGLSSDDAIFVFAARRRPESYTWEIPESDQELLIGRGARGNNSVKEDDTFETLLFMTLEEN